MKLETQNYNIGLLYGIKLLLYCIIQIILDYQKYIISYTYESLTYIGFKTVVKVENHKKLELNKVTLKIKVYENKIPKLVSSYYHYHIVQNSSEPNIEHLDMDETIS